MSRRPENGEQLYASASIDGEQQYDCRETARTIRTQVEVEDFAA